MNTVEQTEYKTSGQLPIIILLLILFAFKYYSGQDEAEVKEAEKLEHQQEVSGMATSSTQDLLIQTPHPMN